MEFFRKIVVVTGGAQDIGKYIVEEFHCEEAIVAVIDTQERPKDYITIYY